MLLSEAIKRRQQLLDRAEEMEKWVSEQRFGKKELKWIEMIMAVNAIVDKAFDDYHKFNEAIEKDIKQLTIEI